MTKAKKPRKEKTEAEVLIGSMATIELCAHYRAAAYSFEVPTSDGGRADLIMTRSDGTRVGIEAKKQLDYRLLGQAIVLKCDGRYTDVGVVVTHSDKLGNPRQYAGYRVFQAMLAHGIDVWSVDAGQLKRVEWVMPASERKFLGGRMAADSAAMILSAERDGYTTPSIAAQASGRSDACQKLHSLQRLGLLERRGPKAYGATRFYLTELGWTRLAALRAGM